jgi:hypothetical protein
MPNADFSQADVTMMRGETAVALRIEAPFNDRGLADNTLVWLPEGVPIRAPTQDVRYTVRIAGVVVAGATRAFHYEVVIIDPETELPEPPRVVQQPGDLVVPEGSQAVFTVEATGTPPALPMASRRNSH